MSGNKEILGLHRITKSHLKELCKKHQLYQTPHLNDQLYLHFQGFQAIENLEEYTGLKCLWLENNAISEIQGLEYQKELKCLFLQNNLIRKIENLEFCNQLDTLNLASNHISKIENCGTDVLPVLSTLNLSRNYIRSSEGLRELVNCKSLWSLDLSHNRIDDILVVKIFASMPELRVLVLQGNPVVNKVPQYRKTLILECKNLTYLDSRPVFPRDRACAEAWKRGGYEEERNEHIRWNKREQKKIRDSVNATLRLRIKNGDKEVQLITSSDEEGHGDEHESKKIKLTQDAPKDLEIIGVELGRSSLDVNSIEMENSSSAQAGPTAAGMKLEPKSSVDSGSLDVSFSSVGDVISVKSGQELLEGQHTRLSSLEGPPVIQEKPETQPEVEVSDENDASSLNQKHNLEVVPAILEEGVKDEFQESQDIEEKYGNVSSDKKDEETAQGKPEEKDSCGLKILEEDDARLSIYENHNKNIHVVPVEIANDKRLSRASIDSEVMKMVSEEQSCEDARQSSGRNENEVTHAASRTLVKEEPCKQLFVEGTDARNSEEVAHAVSEASIQEEPSSFERHDNVAISPSASSKQGSCGQLLPKEENVPIVASEQQVLKDDDLSTSVNKDKDVCQVPLEGPINNEVHVPLKFEESLAAVESEKRRSKDDERIVESNFAPSVIMRAGTAFSDHPTANNNSGDSSTDSDTSSTASFELSSASEMSLTEKEISEDEEDDKKNAVTDDILSVDRDAEKEESLLKDAASVEHDEIFKYGDDDKDNNMMPMESLQVMSELKEESDSNETEIDQNEPISPTHEDSMTFDELVDSPSTSLLETLGEKRSTEAIYNAMRSKTIFEDDAEDPSDEEDSGLFNSTPIVSTVSQIESQDDGKVLPSNVSTDADDTLTQDTSLSEDQSFTLEEDPSMADATLSQDEEPTFNPEDIEIPEIHEVKSWLKNLISGLKAEEEREFSDSSSLTESLSAQSADEDTEDNSDPIRSMSLSDLKADLGVAQQRMNSEEDKHKEQLEMMESGEKEEKMEVTLQQIMDEISLGDVKGMMEEDDSNTPGTAKEVGTSDQKDSGGDKAGRVYEDKQDKEEGAKLTQMKEESNAPGEDKIPEDDEAREVTKAEEDETRNDTPSEVEVEEKQTKKTLKQDKAEENIQAEEYNTPLQTSSELSDYEEKSWWERTLEAARSGTSSAMSNRPEEDLASDEDIEDVFDESKSFPPEILMESRDLQPHEQAAAADLLDSILVETEPQADLVTLETNPSAKSPSPDFITQTSTLPYERDSKMIFTDTKDLPPQNQIEEVDKTEDVLDSTLSDNYQPHPSTSHEEDQASLTTSSSSDSQSDDFTLPLPDPPTPTLRESLDSFNKALETINKRREERLNKINDFVNHPLTKENALQTHEQLDQQIEQIKLEKRERVRQLVEHVYAQREKYDDSLEVIEGRLMIVKRGTGALEEVPPPQSSTHAGAMEESMADENQTPCQYVSRGVSTNSVCEVRRGVDTTPEGAGSDTPSLSDSDAYGTPLSENELDDDGEVERHQSDTKIRKITLSSMAERVYDSAATRTSGYGNAEVEDGDEVDFEKHFKEKQADSQQRIVQLHIAAGGREWVDEGGDIPTVSSAVTPSQSLSISPILSPCSVSPASVKGEMGREEIMLLKQVMKGRATEDGSSAEGTLLMEATGGIALVVRADDACTGRTALKEDIEDVCSGGNTLAGATEVAIVNDTEDVCIGETTLEKTTNETYAAGSELESTQAACISRISNGDE